MVQPLRPPTGAPSSTAMNSGRLGAGPTRGATRWVWALIGAVLAVASFIGLERTFIESARGQIIDESALLGSTRGKASLEGITQFVVGIVSVRFLIAVVVVAVVVALVRKQWGDAARAVVIVAGANLTTQILKEMIERPEIGGAWAPGNSLPSGHTTVAASAAAVALLVAPRAARPIVAIIGAIYAAATGIATMSLGWHRPSDVIAAIAVVTAWTLLVMVPSRGRPADGPSGTAGRVVSTWLLGIAAVVGIAVGVLSLLGVMSQLNGVGQDVDLLSSGTLTLAYIGSAATVVGAASASAWAQILARR